MREIWKDIDGYNGKYQVSSNGRVRNTGYQITKKNGSPYTVRRRIMKLVVSGAGYLAVTLSDSGIYKRKYVHRLVASAFIPNPHFKKEVNHINGIKSDNRVENLEWASPSENIAHAYKSGLIKRPSGKNAYFKKPVIDTSTGEMYDTAKQAAKAMGMKYNTLICKLTGKNTNNTSLKYV